MWFSGRNYWLMWARLGLILTLLAVLSACRSQVTVAPSVPAAKVPRSATPTGIPSGPTGTPTRILALESGNRIESVGSMETASPTPDFREGLSLTSSVLPPGVHTSTPGFNASPTPTPNPGQNLGTYPGVTNQNQPYPGITNPGFTYPGLANPVATGTSTYPGGAGGIFGALEQNNPTLPAPTATIRLPTSTAVGTLTPVRQATATRVPTLESSGVFSPIVVLPGGGNPVVEIWHSFEGTQLAMLKAVVQEFQLTYPHISLVLTFFPLDDLRQAYETGIYQGRGPDLLIGNSSWNDELARTGQAADIQPYFSEGFWGALGGTALRTGLYQDKQTSLPFIQRGSLLYRNRQLIPQPAASFDELLQTASETSGGGVIGGYFDLGAYYALPFFESLGGAWSGEAGRPDFDQDRYALALDWMDVLSALDQAGAVEVNTNRDLNLFIQGKVGYIFDGTWNLQTLSQALGAANLAVDPWPRVESGRLAGYVQAQSIYLNPAAAASQDSNRTAALQFMGALVSSPAQQRFAAAGFIPVRVDFQIQDPLLEQAFAALQHSHPYPGTVPDEARVVYWAALEKAVRSVLGLSGTTTNPLTALRTAFDEIEEQWFALP